MKLWKKLSMDNRAYVQAVGALVALLVTIGVGAIVFFEITATFDGQADADAAVNDTEDMGATVFELLPIIALVVVASIIIGIVITMGAGFGGKGNGF